MKRINTKYFQEYIHSKFRDLIVLSEYKNGNSRIYLADRYAVYSCYGYMLLHNKRPGINSAIDKNAYFKNRAIEIHKGKYDYSKCNYTGSKIKLTIICNVHGEFKQTPNRHLAGDGCPICKNSNSGWNKHNFTNKSLFATCYIIHCYNTIESFYKIGITTKSVKERFKKNNMPYNYKIISEYKGSSSNVWEKEKALHRINKNNKYIPKIKFGGMQECFIKIEKDE